MEMMFTSQKNLIFASFKKNKGFTLIELLVVVAIIGILAAVGVVAYNGYTESSKKTVAQQNFKNTVKYFTAEIFKCEMDSSQKAFNLPCPVKVNVDYQACAAIYLSWQYSIRNPKFPKEAAGSVSYTHLTLPTSDLV